MIFKLTKWQLGCQILYCLSDFHSPAQLRNFIGNDQRTTIVQAAKTHNAHVIAEDVYRYIKNKNSCDQTYVIPPLLLMQLTPKDSPLFGLSSFCYHAGVTSTNVEFRGTNLISYFFEQRPTFGDILIRVQTITERIGSYNDGPIANAWYKQLLDEFTQFSNGPAQSFLQQFKIHADKPFEKNSLRHIKYSVDMQKALENLYPEFEWSKMDNYEQKLCLLQSFNYKLLDAEIIHSLLQQSNKNAIFICAGAAHISNIKPVLRQLGYKKVLSEGNDLIVVEGVKYKEPDAIPTNRLSQLLESKNTELPFLLTINLHIQSFFNKKNIGPLTRSTILSLSAFATTMGIASFLPSWRFNRTLLQRFFLSYVTSRGLVWYLSRPIKTSDF